MQPTTHQNEAFNMNRQRCTLYSSKTNVRYDMIRQKINMATIQVGTKISA